MGRGKIEIKRIDNLASRQVTFSKRRKGLMKKAKELAILCDADVGLLVISDTSKVYEFASNNMQAMVDQYHQVQGKEKLLSPASEAQFWKMEAQRLKEQHDELSKSHRHLLGEDLSNLTVDHLDNLVGILDSSIKGVRAKKEVLVHQENLELRRRLGIMQSEVTKLREKIYEARQNQAPGGSGSSGTLQLAGSTSGHHHNDDLQLQLKPASLGDQS